MYIDNIVMTHFLVSSFHESQPAHEISNYDATKTMVLQVAFSTCITILITLTPPSDLFELLQPKSTISYHWSEGNSDVLPAA